MTQAAQEPTTPLELQLTEEVAQLRTTLARTEEEAAYRQEQLQNQLNQRPTQEDLDQALAARNNARQQADDLEQERARLYSVLQDTVAGVQSWVPDLSPVPQPPATVPPEMHAAWVADQIAQRRQGWDSFVHRVVTQANV